MTEIKGVRPARPGGRPNAISFLSGLDGALAWRLDTPLQQEILRAAEQRPITNELVFWVGNFFANASAEALGRMNLSTNDGALVQQLLSREHFIGCTIKFHRRGEVTLSNIQDVVFFFADLHDTLISSGYSIGSRLVNGKNPITPSITQEWSEAA